ncbi:MAG: flagella cluster protein [Halobacteriales archaeon]|nr:flagella cluster protein [Halobacteriales archaeon]
MEPLDITDGFDVHAHRDGLKLIKQDSDSWQLQNRDAYACPSCGRVFDRVFVTTEPTVTFDTAPTSPICLARTPDELLLLTHPDTDSTTG